MLAELRRKDAHRGTFADEPMWGVAGNSTGPSVSTRLPFTSVEHSVAVLTCGEISPKDMKPSFKKTNPSIIQVVKTKLFAVICQSRYSETLVTLPPMDREFTCVSGATLAAVVVGKLDAVVCASWVAGVGQTFIYVSLTALADVPRGADALIPSDLIHTLPFVEALWLFGDLVEERVAVIDVDLTVHT